MSTAAPAPEFWDHALCTRVENADLFHPGRGGRCPVRERCLEWALSLSDDADRYGIYGGLGPPERRAIRKQRREAQA